MDSSNFSDPLQFRMERPCHQPEPAMCFPKRQIIVNQHFGTIDSIIAIGILPGWKKVMINSRLDKLSAYCRDEKWKWSIADWIYNHVDESILNGRKKSMSMARWQCYKCIKSQSRNWPYLNGQLCKIGKWVEDEQSRFLTVHEPNVKMIFRSSI